MRTPSAFSAATARLVGLLLVSAMLGCGGPVSPPPSGNGSSSAGPEVSETVSPSPTSPSPTSSFPTGTGPTSPGPTGPTTSRPSATPSGAPGAPSTSGGTAQDEQPCAREAAALTLREQVGQLFMVGVDTGAGLGRLQAESLANTRVGSAVLLGNTTAGAAAVRRLASSVRDAARTPDGVGMLLAADQEGGQVQRLRGSGFDRIPSAFEQADRSNSRLRADAEVWGRQLKEAGIDADLAPVADVVPVGLTEVNQPIGVLRRGYGPDADVVADKVSAFVRGMAAAGVVTSVKHFPGLGKVRGNTDFQARVVDSTTTRKDPDLAGFRAAVASGVDMVMMSSAYYAKIDEEDPAAFSATVVQGMLRADMGFSGVVVSDDLAAQAVQYLPPGRRALRFLRAGGDLIIVGDPSLLPRMADAVLDEAQADSRFADEVTRHVARVLQMKARKGLADCG